MEEVEKKEEEEEQEEVEEEEEDEEFRKLEINKNIDYGRITTTGGPLMIVIS